MTSNCYTSNSIGFWGRLRELVFLLQAKQKHAATHANQLLSEAKELENRLSQSFNFELKCRDVLEIGPGPHLVWSRYFARNNRVTALDTDIIAIGFSPVPYVEMLRRNGPLRVAKTLARKAAGVDRAYRLASGLNHTNGIKLVCGSAVSMPFDDGSYDAVVSRSVFHHIPTPEIVLKHITRILRPGGVAFVSLHLYHSYNGHLDPRVLSNHDDARLWWAHLRQDVERPQGNAYLNKLNLMEWETIFRENWPDCIVETDNSKEGPKLHNAQNLVSSGAITGFEAEVLMKHTMRVTWRKRGRS